MKEITLGQYYPQNSIVHSLDPRTKILITLFLIVGTFVTKTFVGLGICLMFIVFSVLLAKIPLYKAFSSLKAVWFILLFTFLLNVFFIKEGDTIVEIWRISITSGGVVKALFMALRLMLLIVGTGVMTLTTTPIQLTDGLERLMSPFKKIGFPAHEIAMMMSIAMRFIPILSEEADKIMKAQSARGANFSEGSLFKRAKAIIALLIPLLASAFHRAIELASAMEARCYHGGEGRTRLKVLKMQKRDFCAFAVFLFVFMLILGDNIFLSRIL